jgi:glycosyltransferase involved in cell wall biosynthesis
VHLLGDRPVEELPAHLAAWDVGLLPLALHGPHVASQSLPLEYMAAELPIVTTPAPDVIEAYGDIVLSGRTPEDFVEACEQALGEHESTRVRRATRMRQVLARTSWDVTIEAMDDLVAVLERGYRPKSGAPPVPLAPVNVERTPRVPAPHAPA